MQVSAYPPFPGTEAHFLRAQLARIAASTILCPAGYFTANEEGGLDKAEDFTPPAPTDLATAGAWAHRYPHLKKQGEPYQAQLLTTSNRTCTVCLPVF